MAFVSRKFLFHTFLIATVYFIIVIYFMNVSLVTDTILGYYPMDYKFNLLVALLGGIWTAMSSLNLIMLCLLSLLSGANLTLVW